MASRGDKSEWCGRANISQRLKHRVNGIEPWTGTVSWCDGWCYADGHVIRFEDHIYMTAEAL